MNIKLLSIEQIFDLANAGQTDILNQELMYSVYLQALALDSDYQDLFHELVDYSNLIQSNLS